MRARSIVSAALATTALLAPRGSDACGLAYPRELKPFEYPYLNEEKVLLVWNEQTGTEHFVREVRFQKANRTFGFVVPTPTLPKVAKVDTSPFPALENGLPFEVFGGIGVGGWGTGMGFGAGGAAKSATPPVEVLAVQRIGRFHAFTLAAHDAKGFRAWLDENAFATSPELERWLAHYVDLGFHFVAFRYEAKPEDAPGMTSETVRISFETPLPYYPYFEPRPPTSQSVRRLTTWFVSQQAMKPVAAIAREGKLELVQPWHTGADYHPTPKLLGAAIGELASLLPVDRPELKVQVFRDRKVSREGFHDLVFVPASPPAANAEPDPAADAKRRAMLGWLDPALVRKAAPAAVAADPSAEAESAAVLASAPAPASAAPTHDAPSPSVGGPGRTGSCSASPGAASAPAIAWILGLLSLARARRRARSPARAIALFSILALSSCRRDESPGPAPSASATPSITAITAVTAIATAKTAASALASAASTAGSSPATSGSIDVPTESERAAREHLLLGAFVGILPHPMKIEAGPYFDPPPVYTSKAKLKIPRIVENTQVLGGPLPVEVVRRVLRVQSPRLRACYELGLKKNPVLAGTVVVKFVIGHDGAVSTAALSNGTLADAQVASCVLGVVRSVSFPEPKGDVVRVTYAPRFSNDDG